MSTKKQRVQAQKAAANLDDAVVDTLFANGVLCIDDLKVSQLRMLVTKQGVPKSESDKMNRPELVKRVLQATNTDGFGGHGTCVPRVLDALDYRAKNSQENALVHCFTRLGSSLLLVVSSFLDLRAIAIFSRCSIFLRHRLSLSSKGAPSPALSNIKTLVVRKKMGIKRLEALVSRLHKLESLQVTSDVRIFMYPSMQRHSFLANLRHLTLRGDCTKNAFECVSACVNLVSLRLDDAVSFDWRRGLEIKYDFPKLTSLIVSNYGGKNENEQFQSILRACPMLETFGVPNLDRISPGIFVSLCVRCTHLRSLDLQGAMAFSLSEGHTFLPLLASLTHLNVSETDYLCNDVGTLPPNLVSLHADFGVLKLRSTGVFSNLRELSLSNTWYGFIARVTDAFPGVEVLSFVGRGQSTALATVRSIFQPDVWPHLTVLKHAHYFHPAQNLLSQDRIVDDEYVWHLVTFKRSRPRVLLELDDVLANEVELRHATPISPS